jgi:hypothetical protein
MMSPSIIKEHFCLAISNLSLDACFWLYKRP